VSSTVVGVELGVLVGGVELGFLVGGVDLLVGGVVVVVCCLGSVVVSRGWVSDLVPDEGGVCERVSV